jgi:hypothetical protein
LKFFSELQDRGFVFVVAMASTLEERPGMPCPGLLSLRRERRESNDAENDASSTITIKARQLAFTAAGRAARKPPTPTPWPSPPPIAPAVKPPTQPTLKPAAAAPPAQQKSNTELTTAKAAPVAAPPPVSPPPAKMKGPAQTPPTVWVSDPDYLFFRDSKNSGRRVRITLTLGDSVEGVVLHHGRYSVTLQTDSGPVVVFKTAMARPGPPLAPKVSNYVSQTYTG